jgi:glucose/arabinose dehydrogenase
VSPDGPAHPDRTPPRRRRALRNAGIFLALALAPGSCNPQCQPPPPAPAPVRYDVLEISNGLANPWDLAWTPTGTLLVTERPGRISAIGNGVVHLIGSPPGVVAAGEGGLMGLAVDPGFATNGWIYTCYMTASDVRVVRLTIGAGFSSLHSPQTIIAGLPRSSGRHSGCRVRIGPTDGLLWVTTGDAAIGTNPQDPRSLGGKVLRVRTDGSIPPGNMQPPYRPEIYAYGFRNPQGITFSSDGTAYLIEHGSDRDDEITPLRAGGNGGWNPVPGYNESVPMTDLGAYPDALRPVWSSGFPTIAPSGGTFVTSSKWGTLAGTHIAMAVLKDQHLRLVNVTNGASSPIVSGQGRIRVAVEGPDGNLWLATDANPGRILLVTPVR